MLGFLLLCCLLAGVQAVPQPCKSQTINVQTAWTLPPTNIASYQYCTYTFVIPSDSYAHVNVTATSITYSDAVFISDNLGDATFKSSKDPMSDYSSSLAWPTNFEVNIQTQGNTQYTIAIDILIKKRNIYSNTKQNAVLDTNSAAFALYTKNFQEGETYIFTSKSSTVDIKTADTSTSVDEEAEWNNIFVYDNDTLIGTLLRVYNKLDYVSIGHKLTLFVGKKPRTVLRGAVVINDYSNIAQFNDYFLAYAPVSMENKMGGILVPGSDTKPGAVTIVGDQDGSTPIDVVSYRNLDDNNGIFTYSSGCPMADHSSAPMLKIPLRMTANLNTVYISKGAGVFEYTTPGN